MAEVQDFDETSEIDAVEEQIKEQEEPKAEAPELPPQYRGKSVEDIVKMHQEAEKLIARQGAEVGEVRKLADELIKSQLAKRPEPVEKPKEVDFFENPQEAVRQAVETNPVVMQARDYALQVQRQQAQQAFLQKHPDAQQVVATPEFQEWVRASKVRTKLFQQADAFDVDAGDELLSTFKELRQVKQKQMTEVDTKVRDQALKSAAVDTGGSGESSKKVYRRADLIRLKMRDPSKYESMSDEIMTAYREGRVK